MTFTNQITSYTCGLACLESFYRDRGNPTTQQDLLNNHPAQCFVGRLLNGQDITGALNLPEFEALCQHLNLQPQCFLHVDSQFTISYIQNVQPNQAIIFYVVHFGGGGGPTHYVGFSKFLVGDQLEVMNPSDNPQFAQIAWQQLAAWQTVVIRVSL